MRLLLSALILLVVLNLTFGQRLTSVVQKSATTNVADVQADLFPGVIYHEVPDGHARSRSVLAEIKDEVAKRYPRIPNVTQNTLRGSSGPQVLNGVRGLLGSLGIPLDNHLAVSNDGMVATVANFHLANYDKDGNYIKAVSLIQLTRDLRLPDFRFDPRIIYDPVSDKFLLVMLHSTDKDRNSIIVAFSESNDPNGNWHLYVIDGNPFDINVFSDYPMLSITNDNLYITVNAVDVDSTWQAGFVESYIWEIGKSEGHQGEAITTTMYNEIHYNDKPIRNLCPITTGDENLLDVQYFLSNRNFDLENDTIFLIKLENGTISTSVLKADTPYGVPPNAVQNQNLNLQTNDARILDAYLQDGHVQFVGNCVNPANGFAVIYHGLIEDIGSSSTVQGNVLAYGDLELGYPDISYAGTNTGDRRSIIVTSHVGEGRFPGVSALEFDGSDFSDLVTLHEGEGYITRIGGSLQRWGDYSGNQRKYDQPGVCWTVSSLAVTTGNMASGFLSWLVLKSWSTTVITNSWKKLLFTPIRPLTG